MIPTINEWVTVDIDKDKNYGTPLIKGTIVNAHDILNSIADGDTLDEIADSREIPVWKITGFLDSLSRFFNNSFVEEEK